jgi:hypothetical protein
MRSNPPLKQTPPRLKRAALHFNGLIPQAGATELAPRVKKRKRAIMTNPTVDTTTPQTPTDDDLARRRKIERDRIRFKRENPIYLAADRARNRLRMRKFRESMRRRSARVHDAVEAHP